MEIFSVIILFKTWILIPLLGGSKIIVSNSFVILSKIALVSAQTKLMLLILFNFLLKFASWIANSFISTPKTCLAFLLATNPSVPTPQYKSNTFKELVVYLEIKLNNSEHIKGLTWKKAS